MVLGGLLWGLLHEVGAQPRKTEGLKAFGICVHSAECRLRTEQFATWAGCSALGRIYRGKAARDGAVSGIASTAWVQIPLQGGLWLKCTNRTWGHGDPGMWKHGDPIPQCAVGSGDEHIQDPVHSPTPPSLHPGAHPSQNPKPKAAKMGAHIQHPATIQQIALSAVFKPLLGSTGGTGSPEGRLTTLDPPTGLNPSPKPSGGGGTSGSSCRSAYPALRCAARVTRLSPLCRKQRSEKCEPTWNGYF